MDEKTTYIQGEINARKLLLSNSDYQCLKYAEGALSEKEYADVKAKRQTWRDEINNLEAELEAELTKESEAEKGR